MSGFLLHTEQQKTETPVSNIFLDEYMPEANGEYVKVYLYLLRCLKSGIQSLSIPSIADWFEHTETDIRRALSYWEKLKLIRLEYDEGKVLTGICLLEPHSKNTDNTVASDPQAMDTASSKTVPAKKAVPSNTAAAASIPKKNTYSPDQLDKFQEDHEIRQLLFISEQYLGKTLSFSEISTICYFYDSLCFPIDLIEYLIEYCVSNGHKSLRYIESVALAWHEQGYQTVAQAKQGSSLYTKSYFAVLKAFGIKGRNPAKTETRYIDRWLKEWGFPIELVTEACDRTMAAIHQPSFEYADSILKNWHTNKVTTLADVEALNSQRSQKAGRQTQPSGSSVAKKASSPNRFHNFKQRDYNFKELEKQLINQ